LCNFWRFDSERSYRSKTCEPFDFAEAVQPQSLAASGSAGGYRHISHERYNYPSSRNDSEVFVLTESLLELTSAANEETTPRELPAASRARLQPAQTIKAALRRGRFLFSTSGYVASPERARRSAGSPPPRSSAELSIQVRATRSVAIVPALSSHPAARSGLSLRAS
jgi:hypothetical protein